KYKASHRHWTFESAQSRCKAAPSQKRAIFGQDKTTGKTRFSPRAIWQSESLAQSFAWCPEGIAPRGATECLQNRIGKASKIQRAPAWTASTSQCRFESSSYQGQSWIAARRAQSGSDTQQKQVSSSEVVEENCRLKRYFASW